MTKISSEFFQKLLASADHEEVKECKCNRDDSGDDYDDEYDDFYDRKRTFYLAWDFIEDDERNMQIHLFVKQSGRGYKIAKAFEIPNEVGEAFNGNQIDIDSAIAVLQEEYDELNIKID